jgi:Delta carbonic anhydrase
MTTRRNAGSLILTRCAIALAKAAPCALALIVLADLQVARAQDPASCTKAGIGPQSPRDLTKLVAGTNPVTFAKAPPAGKMHLCNVHFHQFAEHRGTGYSGVAGKGDNKGYYCNASKPLAGSHGSACKPKGDGHGSALAVGDTIEVHWVFTSCDVKPGPGLGGCASCPDAQLRVEGRVFYLTNDAKAAAFAGKDGTIPLPAAGKAVEYLGSTTGPKYGKATDCSPFPVTWHVSQACSPLNIKSVANWCANDNVYKEDHAHGVRPLVKDAKLLSRVR